MILMATEEEIRAELLELRAIGDLMQSASSRVLDWITSVESIEHDSIPYEVRGALHEIRSTVAKWTEIRKTSRNIGLPRVDIIGP
jgi:hypothetical protein